MLCSKSNQSLCLIQVTLLTSFSHPVGSMYELKINVRITGYEDQWIQGPSSQGSIRIISTRGRSLSGHR